MKAQCLPFRQIPHTTRLFSDFLSWSPAIQPFYSRSPYFAQWYMDETAHLRAGASALVTGQQVGLFGGPLFSVFKALSTVKLAGEATRAGSGCVPIFWLATSDHDLDEINHVSLLGPEGSLQKFSVPTRLFWFISSCLIRVNPWPDVAKGQRVTHTCFADPATLVTTALRPSGMADSCHCSNTGCLGFYLRCRV